MRNERYELLTSLLEVLDVSIKLQDSWQIIFYFLLNKFKLVYELLN